MMNASDISNNHGGMTGLTLSQLQASIKNVLCKEFGAPLWITAEIGDLKVNGSSGHCYMELVEKGGTNGVPKAQARAVAWRNVWGILSSYFAGATGRHLTAGMKVLISVTVNYHELYGLSLNVHDIDPLYTLGEIELQKQKTIQQLKEDGIFDLNRQLEIPLVIQRIAIISSPSAAGFQDFINELSASPYIYETVLFETIMQGHGAEASIVEALSRIVESDDIYDAVILIRGGGSQTDLSFLNSYLLCSHIAQYPLPIITGLGHDKDTSIADMVAAVPLKTPTAVAGYLINLATQFDRMIHQMQTKLSDMVSETLAAENRRLRDYGVLLQNRVTIFSRNVELRLERLSGQIERLGRDKITRQNERLITMSGLLRERTARLLANARSKVESFERLTQSNDPQKVLARGFAIVRQGGKAVCDASELTPGQTIDITLAHGEINAKVTKINNGKGN